MVTNKEIYLVRVVSYLCKVLCHLFAQLLIEKKEPFFLAIGFCCKYAFITSQSCYDILKFQNDLVVRASSKNFYNRLHNLKCFFFFFYVISFKRFLDCFFDLYITRRDFFVSGRVVKRSRKRCIGEREID